MFLVFPDSAAIAAHLSARLQDIIRQDPQATLGLATGGTMEPVYARFVQDVRANGLDVSKINSFNLDEYVGLSAEHEQSYAYYMRQHLFGQLPFDAARLHLPNGLTKELEQHCQDYSAAIAASGGVALQLLGVGTNGHIGFNEPGTPFDSRTHIVALSERTRIDNSRFFDSMDEVPASAITMGIADILSAREIALVVTGEHKARTMLNYQEGGVTPELPFTALKQHANTHILLDEAAASLLDPNLCHRPLISQAA
ncbi:glucosamine-6-phosphate deaminase [Alcaligenes faecalis]|uniref:glucosamine-6-phosphate deaminase n=1 Tax=Alcaligenes faecalis TaxID=511 RepID=UPI0012937BD1|nr:glucosamine-6-phosphate deaminase [Alcaligenes faecalis]QFY77041.1 glucosamine-6-phosphate deaminase [Alcaligenes faecalis]